MAWFTVALALFVFLVLVNRNSRLALLWGGLWGSAIGAWVLSPILVRLHYLYPRTLVEWLIVDGTLVFAFVLLGSLLSVLACLPMTVWLAVRRRAMRRPEAACALVVVLVLPIAYFAFSAQLERANFRRPLAITQYRSLFAPVLLLEVLLGLLLAVWYRHLARAGSQFAEPTLRRAVAMAAVAGLLVLPLRIGSPPTFASRAQEPLVRRADDGRVAPLLVIGLDSGNWRTIRPLVEAGQLPTLAGLIATGAHGDVAAPWPPYWSAPAWGAIITGYSKDEIGVQQDLAGSAPGLPSFELPLEPTPVTEPLFFVEFALLVQAGLIRPAPAARSALQRPPVWELLSEAGVKTAVVRWPFTFPAAGQADVVISNRIVPDLWDLLGVERGRPDELIMPPSETAKWIEWFSPARSPDESLRAKILPRVARPKPADAPLNPFDVLARVLDNDDRVLAASGEILRTHPEIAVLMVHLPGFDNVCHAFWPYRFPEDFPSDPPAPSDVEELGPVIDRYLMFLDERLGRLIATFPTRPNVIIVSDHGHVSSTTHPLWRGWHGPQGIYIAAGPGIPRASIPLSVSYDDVAPTVLDLQGFARPNAMSGSSLLRGTR
jgi:hypothetical protein